MLYDLIARWVSQFDNNERIEVNAIQASSINNSNLSIENFDNDSNIDGKVENEFFFVIFILYLFIN